MYSDVFWRRESDGIDIAKMIPSTSIPNTSKAFDLMHLMILNWRFVILIIDACVHDRSLFLAKVDAHVIAGLIQAEKTLQLTF